MTALTINVPEASLAALRRSPFEFARELKLAAAIHWYRQGTLSQERAAELAGLNRRDFIRELARNGVEVFMLDEESLAYELGTDPTRPDMSELMCWVVNTSPLIHLAEAGLLHLLRDAAGMICVPEAVAREIRAYGADDPTARALTAHAWLDVIPVASIPESILTWNLGAGESAVLALALCSPNVGVVIDDLAGRRCAQAMGLRLRGTVGLVLPAKQPGGIPSARSVLEQLRDSGMYLSDATLNRALAQVGE
jgi:predicted nucleic acid-binding protein/predicted HTH domain antitoxin